MDFSPGSLSIVEMSMQQYDKLSAGSNSASLAHSIQNHLLLLQSLILTTGSILDQNQIMHFSNSLNLKPVVTQLEDNQSISIMRVQHVFP